MHLRVLDNLRHCRFVLDAKVSTIRIYHRKVFYPTRRNSLSKRSILHENFNIGAALSNGEFYSSNRWYSGRSLDNTCLNPVSISIILIPTFLFKSISEFLSWSWSLIIFRLYRPISTSSFCLYHKL